MRMRTTTDEEREAAQARLESWARGEDAESLRALAEHLAAGQASSMSQVDVEHYTTTLRTAVDIDIHTDPGVDPRGLAAWFRVRDSQVLWDGVWLSTANADDVDHITTIRLDAAWCVPDTDPIPAHPEHGPHLHIREDGTWGRCALCDNLYYMPYRDDRPMDMPRVMTQLQRAIMPGATTHPTDEHTTRLYAINHEDTP